MEDVERSTAAAESAPTPENPPRTFTGYSNRDDRRLPELDNKDFPGGDVGRLADLFHASGYFGDLTPAQLAVHIIAGRSLGLDDAQSVFDLEIKDGPGIVYKPTMSYQAAADSIEATKIIAEAMANGGRRSGPATPEPALPEDNVKSGVVVDGGFTSVKNLPGGGFEQGWPPPACTENKELADALTEFAITGDPSALIEPVEPLRERENVDFEQKTADLANKAPVLNSEPADGQAPAPAPNLSSAAPIPANSGAISDEPLPEVSPVPDRDGPPTPADLVRWRAELLKMTGELGLDVARVMNEYDGLDVEAKRQKVESAWSYYESKVSVIRDMIRDALAADSKPTLDSQAGFYMFADVPGNPDNWTYPQAQKAERALVEFFKRPTAPAA